MAKHRNHEPTAASGQEVKGTAQASRGSSLGKYHKTWRTWRLADMATPIGKCKCCRKPVQTIAGIITDKHGEELGTYRLELSEHGRHGRIAQGGLRLSVKAVGKAFPKPQQRTVSVAYEYLIDGICYRLATAKENPFGEALTNMEAVQAPFLQAAFAMCEFIVHNHAELRNFLNRDK
jgi:hypothetical protein